jgi:trigger factor
LLSRVSFELPESVLSRETRNAVYNIVHENQQRGVSTKLIEEQKEQIYSVAADSARSRVKANFLMQKIAEKEDIKVSQEEVARRIEYLAGMYQLPPDKFLKDLQKRNGIVEIYDQVAAEKTLDFLQANAKIEDAAPEPKAV